MSPQVMGAGPHGYFLPYQHPQFFSQPQSTSTATLNGDAVKPETMSIQGGETSGTGREGPRKDCDG
jgi:hypothetical protein